MAAVSTLYLCHACGNHFYGLRDVTPACPNCLSEDQVHRHGDVPAGVFNVHGTITGRTSSAQPNMSAGSPKDPGEFTGDGANIGPMCVLPTGVKVEAIKPKARFHHFATAKPGETIIFKNGATMDLYVATGPKPTGDEVTLDEVRDMVARLDAGNIHRMAVELSERAREASKSFGVTKEELFRRAFTPGGLAELTNRANAEALSAFATGGPPRDPMDRTVVDLGDGRKAVAPPMSLSSAIPDFNTMKDRLAALVAAAQAKKLEMWPFLIGPPPDGGKTMWDVDRDIKFRPFVDLSPRVLIPQSLITGTAAMDIKEGEPVSAVDYTVDNFKKAVRGLTIRGLEHVGHRVSAYLPATWDCGTTGQVMAKAIHSFAYDLATPGGDEDEDFTEAPVVLPDETLFREAYKGERGPDQHAIVDVGLEVVATLLRKNRDYGSSVFSPPVLTPDMTPDRALLVRMSDKVARLASLSNREPEVVGEATMDTMKDLAGYAILWLAHKAAEDMEEAEDLDDEDEDMDEDATDTLEDEGDE